MYNTNQKFIYPSRLTIIMRTLLARYSSKPELSALKEIIEKAKSELELGVDYDDYDGGIYYHKLILTVPFETYILIGISSKTFENTIQQDINDIGKISGEEICCVSILVNEAPFPNEKKNVDESMWEEGFRVFISHKVEDKSKAMELKKSLAKYGITAFVAHEDIDPNKEWLATIENALLSMDAFVALITKGYNEKFWTQQEIGFAYCMNKLKGTPFVSIRMGDDPKGFFGHVQAFSPHTDSYADSLCEQWVNHPRMIDSLIVALRKSECFFDSARYFELLKRTTNITELQIKKLIAAYNKNESVYKCFKINGQAGSILDFINGKTNEKYEIKWIGNGKNQIIISNS